MESNQHPITDQRTDEYCRRTIRRWCEMILEGLDKNMPPAITAHGIAALHHIALVYDGKSFVECLSHRWIIDARQRAGFCEYCTNPIAVALTHPPVCERCDHELERESADMDKLLDDE